VSKPLLCLVLLALYALACVSLSALVAISWRAGLKERLRSSESLLFVRLLPSAGALLLVLAVALPAFLIFEPPGESEVGGPALWALAMFSLIIIGDGVRRGWCAWAAAREILRHCAPENSWFAAEGRGVEIADVAEPIVAVIGGWRPRIVAARRVLDACSRGEFRQVIAHEAAHVQARDNLKLLLLIVSPDPLAWLPAGAALAKNWRIAAEFEADERATGSDPRKRVALASALVKVARLATGSNRSIAALSMPVAADDVEGRVRRLLAPAPARCRKVTLRGLAACGVLIAVFAVPLYAPIHQFIEGLVALGS
jgi:Zn-dependent protease with chaperone function